MNGGNLGLRVIQGAGPVQVSMRGVTIRNTAGAAVFVRSDLPEISESVITRNAIGVQCDTNSFVNVVGSVISYNSVDESAATRHSLALPTVPDDKPRKRQ